MAQLRNFKEEELQNVLYAVELLFARKEPLKYRHIFFLRVFALYETNLTGTSSTFES